MQSVLCVKWAYKHVSPLDENTSQYPDHIAFMGWTPSWELPGACAPQKQNDVWDSRWNISKATLEICNGYVVNLSHGTTKLSVRMCLQAAGGRGGDSCGAFSWNIFQNPRLENLTSTGWDGRFENKILSQSQMRPPLSTPHLPGLLPLRPHYLTRMRFTIWPQCATYNHRKTRIACPYFPRYTESSSFQRNARDFVVTEITQKVMPTCRGFEADALWR